MIKALLAFAVCLVSSMGGTLLTLQLLRGGPGMDLPDSFRKRHREAILRLGGVPLAGSGLLAVALVVWLKDAEAGMWWRLSLCCGLMVLLGLVDDVRPLGARVKLVGQLAVALLAYALDFRIGNITYPVGPFSMELGFMALPATLLWLVALPNVVNLIDGVDGLAAGLCLFLFATLGYVSRAGGQGDVALVCLGMAGALLGFLCFNFPPARIFLGDGGAYLLGFALALLSLKSAHKGSVAAVLLVVVIALGLPIMDAAFALLRRAIRGFPLFHADAEHIHHRLQDLGLSDRRLVLGMYVGTVILSLLGLSVFWTQGRTLPVAAGVLFLAALLGVRYLGYVMRWSDLRGQLSHSLTRRGDVEYALLQARLCEIEAERCSSYEGFAGKLRRALSECGFATGPGNGLRTEVMLAGRWVWRLRVVGAGQPIKHWRRLAQCFRGARLKALNKWPGQTEDLDPLS
jgi:UDP-GlcNAc:undecaprenyl-phosphate/decaprenyl-phosphate GlcNAc-1-phosphate transferase